MMKDLNKKSGFTLIEMTLVIAIISLIAVAATNYVSQGVRLWNYTVEKIEVQENVRAALNSILGEMREMLPSDNGSYPLVSALDQSVEFYANVDDDPQREKIKYELIDGSLYRSAVDSNGAQPPQYPNFTTDDRTLVTDNITNQNAIFKYYDNTYNGESAPLSSPFDLNDVSLIQITLDIDKNSEQPPEPFTIETGVSLRNLKYKYDN